MFFYLKRVVPILLQQNAFSHTNDKFIIKLYILKTLHITPNHNTFSFHLICKEGITLNSILKNNLLSNITIDDHQYRSKKSHQSSPIFFIKITSGSQ